MTIADHCRFRGITQEAFAKRAKIRREYIWRYDHIVVPRPAVMLRIIAESEGDVSFADFFDRRTKNKPQERTTP